jgi:hypothetical protein
MKQGNVSAAGDYFDEAVTQAGSRPAIRVRAASARLRQGATERARTALGNLEQVSGLQGAWLGLHARFLNEAQKAADAERAWGLAIAIDPLGPDAACGGYNPHTSPAIGTSAVETPGNLPLPSDPTRRKLCEAARNIVRD